MAAAEKFKAPGGAPSDLSAVLSGANAPGSVPAAIPEESDDEVRGDPP